MVSPVLKEGTIQKMYARCTFLFGEEDVVERARSARLVQLEPGVATYRVFVAVGFTHWYPGEFWLVCVVRVSLLNGNSNTARMS